MKLGVLSDTHDYLDPQITGIFAGVDHILHGGDIGLPWIILQLEQIAPVSAVIGNTDIGLPFAETEVIQFDHRKLLLHHIVDPHSPNQRIHQRIAREKPDVVVFGHTHKPFCQTIGQTLFFNPGYAGKQRFDLKRTVAILHCDAAGIAAEYFDL